MSEQCILDKLNISRSFKVHMLGHYHIVVYMYMPS